MYPSAPLGVWESVGTGAAATVTHHLFPENVNASRARCMSPGANCTWTHDLFTNKTLERLALQAAAGPDAPPLFLILVRAFTADARLATENGVL